MMLEKIANQIGSFVSKGFNTCISIVKIILLSSFRVKLPQAPTTSCIILGNGPSLNDDLQNNRDFLKKHPLVCVNGFSLSPEYATLQPSYYVMLDPRLWEFDDDVKKILHEIAYTTTWELQIFAPQVAKKSVLLNEVKKQNPKITVTYYNYTVYKGFSSFGYFFYRKNLAMLQSQNVMVASLFLCINMNFKNIYIFGVEHSWHQNLHVNEANQLCIKDTHFYDNEVKVNYRLFYKNHHKTDTFSMHEIFATLAKTFYGYEQLRAYANHRKARVLNCCENSFIDAFERKKIE
jgi:hypothetical protein